ncbi:hypothetical protein [Prescottella agglutinans]|uniref:Uncharacterized protein n=1 Tax=Prescottella agglutinans TaxID=1644129 RepID=A0ABT6M9M4_9NOCA|nr:hypothetical protein [Prescottella agglutinans]MDH6281002.1 hypothetical protein [Prescottella agglutinans]
MNEAALGIHTGDEPAVTRPEPSDPIEDDPGGARAGVTLPRLLAVARLTPAQAAQLSADVVDELERVGVGGGRPITLRDDAAMVSDGGRLTLDGTGSAASRIEAKDAIAGLLGGIAKNCRGSALGDRLIESVSDTTDPDDLIRRVRRVIDPELDPDEEARRRRQIGELVAATIGRPRPDGRAVEEPAIMQNGPCVPAGSLAPPTGWYPPVRNAWHRGRRRPSRRRMVFILSGIILLVGAVAAGPRMWAELNRGWDAIVDPVNPAPQNHLDPVSPPPEPTSQPGAATGTGGAEAAPVRTGAPASAGPITGVTASFADGSCTAGQPCDVRVDVHLDSGATVDAVTWKLNVYDRCSGEVHTGADVTLPVEPGRDGVYGLSKTFLPPGSALAVAAVTSAPATAASEPLYVPAEKATC